MGFETETDKVQKKQQVGKNVIRKDGLEKVKGTAAFGDDMELEEMLYGKAVRSDIAHGRLKRINLDKAWKVPGVVEILASDDVPGENRVGIIFKDEPVLIEEKVCRYGDAICLIAAKTKESAEIAAKKVEVEYEELEVVTDPFEAMGDNAPIIHEHKGSNVVVNRKLIKNDVDSAFEDCDLVVERNYKTNHAAHAFLEPQVTVASYENNILTFWAGSQNIHYDRREVSRVLNLPQSSVRGIQSVTGGGFGGKLDIASQCHAALLSYYTNKPVKINHSFEESFNISSKRHPYHIRYKTGVNADGNLMALEAEFFLDTGAYCSYGPGVVTRGMVHGTGPYEVPNVRITGYLVYTNNPMAGAMRGFGVPQVSIAHESQMDIIAEKLNIDPFEIRLKNSLKVGSKTATNQALKESVGISKTLEIAREKAREIITDKDG